MCRKQIHITNDNHAYLISSKDLKLNERNCFSVECNNDSDNAFFFMDCGFQVCCQISRKTRRWFNGSLYSEKKGPTNKKLCIQSQPLKRRGCFFFLTFQSRFHLPSNRPVTTYKFLGKGEETDQVKTMTHSCYHGKRSRWRSTRLGGCGQFHVPLGLRAHCQRGEEPDDHPGRSSSWNQDRKGSTVVVNFMSSWVCECIVRLLRRRRVVTFNCRKRNRESSWFLSAWRFMVRQP